MGTDSKARLQVKHRVMFGSDGKKGKKSSKYGLNFFWLKIRKIEFSPVNRNLSKYPQESKIICLRLKCSFHLVIN